MMVFTLDWDSSVITHSIYLELILLQHTRIMFTRPGHFRQPKCSCRFQNELLTPVDLRCVWSAAFWFHHCCRERDKVLHLWKPWYYFMQHRNVVLILLISNRQYTLLLIYLTINPSICLSLFL